MSALLERTEIQDMSLDNRFVRSATYEGMAAEDGKCTPRLLGLMRQLAEGGVGLIITSHAYVHPGGQARPRQLGIYSDELIEGLREMTSAVHTQGGRIALQINHAGFLSSAIKDRKAFMAPSEVESVARGYCSGLSAQDIQDIAQAYGQAARRAKLAGFDAVQIHAAHGFFLSQLLSPRFNRRKDAYGGPVENRARALMEVIEAVRARVGPSFPVLVKMNCRDFIDGGLTLGDSLNAAIMLQELGVDAIELSGGTVFSGDLGPVRGGIATEAQEAYFKEEARAFRGTLRIPLLLVGGIRSFQIADQLVVEGCADYISMSRPFIREPALVNRWASGDLRKAACLSDDRCREPAMSGEGIYCVVEKQQTRITHEK